MRTLLIVFVMLYFGSCSNSSDRDGYDSEKQALEYELAKVDTIPYLYNPNKKKFTWGGPSDLNFINKITNNFGLQVVMFDSLRTAGADSIRYVGLDYGDYNYEIINGDTLYLLGGDLLMDKSKLANYYSGLEKMSMYETDDVKLRVPTNRSGTKIIYKWPSRNIKFGILKKTFDEDQYEMIKTNILKAVEDWKKVCGVNFIYDDKYDNANKRMTIPPMGFGFMVKREFNMRNKVLATAFLGNDAATLRFIRIDQKYFSDTTYDKVGIMRHELGHAMGFLHEHNHKNAHESCKKILDNERIFAYVKDKYDSKSCMHYICTDNENKIVAGTRNLEISEIDSFVAQVFYGPPIQ